MHVRMERNWRPEYTMKDRSDWLNLDTQFDMVERERNYFL